MIDKLRFIEKDINQAADALFKMQNKVGTKTSLLGQDLTNALQSLEDALTSIKFAISDLEEENGQE
jgi:hypothetical protein